ncbi:MAG: hypothetical protein ABIY56_08375 [Dokdonella sp.]
MNLEHSTALLKRYPLLFRSLSWPQSSMQRGIECGDGWYELIDTVCSNLMSEVDPAQANPVVIVQIKRKFGGLRIYLRGGSERQHGMVQLANALSQRLCESCGAPASLLIVGRTYRTRCAAHSRATA